MTGAAQLQLLLELATRKRDCALQELARAQQQQQQAMLQMNQLQGYTAESQQRWMLRAQQGVTTTYLHNQHSFVCKLEQAVSYQHGVLEQLAQKAQQCQARLIEAERKLASLNKYQQRRLQAWHKVQQRQEQHTTDEMAATQYRQHAQSHPWRPKP